MSEDKFTTIKSISQLHKLMGAEPPAHPSISFIKFSDMNVDDTADYGKISLDFYVISHKSSKGEMMYGRNYYDFEEGTMIFTAPNQAITPSNISDVENNNDDGWSLFIHPDLLYNSELGRKMKKYNFFSYEINEALHLSQSEKGVIYESIMNIVKEYNQNIDKHSQSLIISNLELLLNYCLRYYDRQFYTRSNYSQDTVVQIEKILADYFNSDKPSTLGIPTVKYCASQVNLSSNYLSDLLKKETGKNTKEHIDYYIVEKAKNILLSSQISVSEVAFNLGFEYSQYFSKLFKKKTGYSPSQYRTVN
jgi:AraC-like DNA-binding protein